MPMIANIGRRHRRVRLLLAALYLMLTAGAVTMVYPFAIMLAGTTKSGVDAAENRAIPAFLTDRDALYRKYAEALLNESFDTARMIYGVEGSTFQDLRPPTAVNPRLAAEWEAFAREADLPPCTYHVGQMGVSRTRGAVPERLRQFKNEMIRRFDGDLARMNRELGSDFVNWPAFRVREPDLLARREQSAARPFDAAFEAFKARQPIAARYYLSVEGYYRAMYLPARYGRSIASFNRANGTAYARWSDVHLDRSLPAGPSRTDGERAEWEGFVRQVIGLLWVRADPAATPAWRAFLRAKYERVAALNQRYGTAHASLEDVPLPAAAPESGVARVDWGEFIAGWMDVKTGQTHRIAAEHLRVHSVEFLFRDWLQRKHGSRTLNAPSNWLEILPPQQDLHALDFERNVGRIRWEFARRNYIAVFDYLVLHGRAFRNTVIYVVLAVLASLIVNPLAAYALSRYKPRAAYKILLFLMLTMAFPSMVTQIPVFLMLRQFHLLNTYWALILPGLANGYSIFMLKGFFDSLPQELYESAELDGAGEFRIFWTITLRLSTPILAVTALGAFTGAYTNFMMALLLCQDERMWTIMPWLYQLQQRSSEGVVFASLVIAAIPTLLVFCFCQSIIMRGIVVPVEK